MPEMTMEQLEAVLDLARVVKETIQELGRIPSGHLWANMCGFMSYGDYMGLLDLLKEGKFIKEVSHELIWIGAPAGPPNPLEKDYDCHHELPRYRVYVMDEPESEKPITRAKLCYKCINSVNDNPQDPRGVGVSIVQALYWMGDKEHT